MLQQRIKYKLPDVLRFVQLNWDELYEGLQAGRYAESNTAEPGKVRLRPRAVAAGLMELYDYCRTLEADFTAFTAAIPGWIVNGKVNLDDLKGLQVTSCSQEELSELRSQIARLEERVAELERRPAATATRMKVLDI